MEALLFWPEKPGGVSFVPDYPLPTPPPGEVLIRVHLAGICATDLEIVRGYMQFAGIPGHEFVGTVVAGCERLLGRRVVAEINCPCRQCPTCQQGLTNHCPHRTVLGIAGRNGAFAEYLTVPEANCHIVPDRVSDREAVFAEPLAAAAHVLDVQPLQPGASIAVLGSGRLGLLVAQVLGLHDCKPEVIGRNRRTLAFCERRGIRTRPVDQLSSAPTYDIVVECTGSAEGLRLALRLCRPRGTIVLKSTYAGPAQIDLAPAVVNEVSIIGNRCGRFEKALALLAEGRVEVKELISGVYPLEQGAQALEAAAAAENIKILLRPGRE